MSKIAFSVSLFQIFQTNQNRKSRGKLFSLMQELDIYILQLLIYNLEMFHKNKGHKKYNIKEKPNPNPTTMKAT